MNIDTITYKKYFKNKNEKVTSFLNIKGDTKLFVPKILKNIDPNIYIKYFKFYKIKLQLINSFIMEKSI